jgi:hypothetical protein
VPTPTLWRVFPWDPRAVDGAPFSPSHLPPQSGQGRFDLDLGENPSTWYFAETPDHAVAERIQDLRNRTLFEEALFEHGHRLALVAVEAPRDPAPADLCDPVVLAKLGIAPDRLAYRDRDVTRSIATRLHAGGAASGLRWWSAFFGEWHTIALFSDRLRKGELVFGEPETLRLDTPAVVAAASALGIGIE